MEPTQELIDALFIDKVLASRQRSPEQKFLAGGELYESVLERMRMGILMQDPTASDAEIRRQLDRRFHIARVLERNRESQ